MKAIMVFSLLSLLAALSAFGQSSKKKKDDTPNNFRTIEVDLSYGAGSTNELSISPGVYAFQIVNLIPGKLYSLSVIRETVEPAVLVLPNANASRPSHIIQSGPDPCKELKDLMNSIYDATTEIQIGSHASALQIRIHDMESRRRAFDSEGEDRQDKMTAAGQAPCDMATITQAKDLLEATKRKVLQTFRVRSDQKITLKITRIDADNVKTEWQFVYFTDKRREPVLTYGFLASSAKWPYNERTYFMKSMTPESEGTQDPDGQPVDSPAQLQQYQVTRSRSNRMFYPAASVFFSWRPTDYNGCSFRPVFGLSTDATSLDFLFGGQLLLAHNYGISLGLSFTERSMLNGRYQEGDMITESLSDDQLHEANHVFAAFIGISLRLNQPRNTE